jgi:hypothetical protein
MNVCSVIADMQGYSSATSAYLEPPRTARHRGTPHCVRRSVVFRRAGYGELGITMPRD